MKEFQEAVNKLGIPNRITLLWVTSTLRNAGNELADEFTQSLDNSLHNSFLGYLWKNLVTFCLNMPVVVFSAKMF